MGMYMRNLANMIPYSFKLSMRLTLSFLLLAQLLFAQTKPSLTYYLPDWSYDPAVPTPAQYLGYEVGEWHVSHDQLLGYMRELDRVSDRITLREYGRSHENRPLVCLTITAPANHARLEQIRLERLRLTDPAESSRLDLKNMPAVNYMGYSIHGNEASGSNAALAVAYYLAAAQTPEVLQLLQNTVILFDPCFNPDGLTRFATWVNSHRSRNGSPDPAGDEFNEPWPQGRTNHYGFDLNRDWLVTQQPESAGRVAIFQDWKPNVLTDHHEMGSGSTFFFQPGVPSRVNPITPAQNQLLTAKIATYHAAALNEKRVQYFTGEAFDDFYYGKGSTYPDVNGCVGILFEAGSSRGSAQETDNGLLTFPYTIRNHVLASLSTLKAVREMRVELNEYLRDFYKTALEEARKDEVKGYLFADNRDLPGRTLLGLLMQHRIEVRNVVENASANGQNFSGGNAFWVPAEQPQYRLVKGIFDRQTHFQDSIFYDISAWTLPDAFGLQWTAVKAKDFNPRWISAQPGIGLTSRYGVSAIAQPAYAYVLGAVGYELPAVLAELLRAGIRVKLAMQPFEADGQKFAAGSLVIPSEKQPFDEAALLTQVKRMAGEIPLYPVSNGLTAIGPDLGSSNFAVVRPPKVLIATGSGANVAEMGEAWHLLDTRYRLAATLVDAARFSSLNLSKYNVLILADGSFERLPVDKIREWVSNGGTIVATGSSLRWLKNVGLLALEYRNPPIDIPTRRPYGELADDRGARNLPGAIFEAELDRSHPLCFGYERDRLPIFLGDTLFVQPMKNPYATPAVFTKEPLLAGYIHPKQRPLVSGSAAIVVGGIGRGRIVGFAGDPNFRAFWYGTNRLFANAVFFGNLVNSDAVEKK